ncbi:unnamed protein product, partial [Mesorhabditis spiculigera]
MNAMLLLTALFLFVIYSEARFYLPNEGPSGSVRIETRSMPDVMPRVSPVGYPEVQWVNIEPQESLPVYIRPPRHLPYPIRGSSRKFFAWQPDRM